LDFNFFDDDLDFGDASLSDIEPGMEEDFNIPKPSYSTITTVSRRKKRDPVYNKRNPDKGHVRLVGSDNIEINLSRIEKPEENNQRRFKQKIIPFKPTSNRTTDKSISDLFSEPPPTNNGEKKKRIFLMRILNLMI